MNVREMWWEVVDWIYLAQDRDLWQDLAKTGSIKTGTFLTS
jgi:hypothetical protein